MLISGFASKFKGNSYVRDAVVNGGTRMGMGGTIGFVGRAFGGMAARGVATLNGESISSVASRTSDVSGTIDQNKKKTIDKKASTVKANAPPCTGSAARRKSSRRTFCKFQPKSSCLQNKNREKISSFRMFVFEK